MCGWQSVERSRIWICYLSSNNEIAVRVGLSQFLPFFKIKFNLNQHSITYRNGCLCVICKSVGFSSFPISHSSHGCLVKRLPEGICPSYIDKSTSKMHVLKCIWRLYPNIIQNPFYWSCPLQFKRSSSNKWNALLDLIAKQWRFLGISGF